ncbi:G-type lectin S-receptor-like serine/threonine-protein kinase At2g19130 [Gossypium raimondii]|uniref:G-type lectin S-receptor-like serine/threonine-protein kinase At2g19130 n=1 Tax=Gossypium raimondii TaxID=29730 RepID=UPI00063AC5FE|nr:G-type lectin S-receptor-like serine/threonine-protein kinase At2g19130 [Gossypium raimondii]
MFFIRIAFSSINITVVAATAVNYLAVVAMKTKKVSPAWFMFSVLLLFMCLSLETQVCFAVDTISRNQSLSGCKTIDSAGGVFQLGFFRPGMSSNYYIEMWFKKVSQLTTVWVANKDKPIHDIYLSVLKISDGNLVLFNESQVPIWSTNVSPGSGLAISSSVVVVLLDDGNLVLKDDLNSSTILCFGMMLLELVSRRRNCQHTIDEEGTFFPVWVARQLIERTDLLKLLDSRLNGDGQFRTLKNM